MVSWTASGSPRPATRGQMRDVTSTMVAQMEDGIPKKVAQWIVGNKGAFGELVRLVIRGAPVLERHSRLLRELVGLDFTTETTSLLRKEGFAVVILPGGLTLASSGPLANRREIQELVERGAIRDDPTIGGQFAIDLKIPFVRSPDRDLTYEMHTRGAFEEFASDAVKHYGMAVRVVVPTAAEAIALLLLCHLGTDDGCYEGELNIVTCTPWSHAHVDGGVGQLLLALTAGFKTPVAKLLHPYHTLNVGYLRVLAPNIVV